MGSSDDDRRVPKTRRRGRKRRLTEKQIDDSEPEKDLGSDDESQVPNETKSRRSLRTRATTRRKTKVNYNESGKNGDEDFDPDDNEWSDGQEQESQKQKAKKKTVKAGRGPVEERTCPYCKRVVSTRDALRYHIDHYVCRIEECTNPDLVAKSKRKRGKGKGTAKRFRGSEANRTCPYCKRVFTSELGMKYHVKHKVCQQKAATKSQTVPRFHVLQTGDKFVTKFGVVEVVKDDRAIPTSEPPSNAQALLRSWQSSKMKLDSKMSRAFCSQATRLRARRAKIHELYRKRNLSKASIFRAYFEGDPRLMNTRRRDPIQKLRPEPNLEGSFPDRMVECVLIPDRRQRFVGNDMKTPTEIQGEEVTHVTRLFLQRRVLTDPYVEECGTYGCLECGQRFSSTNGLRYHVQGKVCTQKIAAAAKARNEQQEKVNKGSLQLLAGEAVQMYSVPPPSPPKVARDLRKQRKRVRKRKELGIYPEVLLALGFKLVKEDMEFTDDIKLPEPIDQTKEKAKEDTLMLQGDLTVDPPDALLAHLKGELAAEQRKADDQKYGSMYAEVYKALGYKKPRKKRKSSSKKENDIDTTKRRRRSKKSPPPPSKPPPPIIDTLALADEVNSGRYPSMSRYTGDDHDDICLICKDGGELICCDFCKSAEHMKCIRKKFTVKDPEPEDPFMCHKCIQYIMARRNRAEKRRLKRQKRDDARRQQQEALEDSGPDSWQGREYEYLAAKGQETNELVELLQDAQIRLKQSLATTKMNNVRRRIMGY